MSPYTYACTYVRTSIYVCTYACTFIYACTYLHPYTYVHIYVHIHTVCTYVCPYTYVHMCRCTSIYVHIRTYVHMYRYTCTWTYCTKECLHTYIRMLVLCTYSWLVSTLHSVPSLCTLCQPVLIVSTSDEKYSYVRTYLQRKLNCF